MASVPPPELAEPTVRDRLLDAAERVIIRDGIPKLTLEAVAREASISKGGLLYHFPAKSDLVRAIMERVMSRCEAEQQSLLAAQPDEPGAFTRAYILPRCEPPDPEEEPIHAALLAAAGSDPDFSAPIRERSVRWQSQLESDGIDPAIATIVRLAMDGLCLCNMLGLAVPKGALREAVIEKLMAMTRPPADATK